MAHQSIHRKARLASTRIRIYAHPPLILFSLRIRASVYFSVSLNLPLSSPGFGHPFVWLSVYMKVNVGIFFPAFVEKFLRSLHTVCVNLKCLPSRASEVERRTEGAVIGGGRRQPRLPPVNPGISPSRGILSCVSGCTTLIPFKEFNVFSYFFC